MGYASLEWVGVLCDLRCTGLVEGSLDTLSRCVHAYLLLLHVFLKSATTHPRVVP